MTKEETYQTLLPQIEALVAGETEMIANMANIVAVLHGTFGFWWTGFYRVEGDQLVLGSFQGYKNKDYKRGNDKQLKIPAYRKKIAGDLGISPIKFAGDFGILRIKITGDFDFVVKKNA